MLNGADSMIHALTFAAGKLYVRTEHHLYAFGT